MGETIGDFPLYVPSVSVTSIGDGGGSIACVDGFGVLKVGPESAGSAPGPGLLRPRRQRAPPSPTRWRCAAGSGMRRSLMPRWRWIAGARRRRSADLAAQCGLGLHATAEAVIQVAISNMYVEVNKLIARYGVDPRDFTLLPFGGAGPMLGCLLARELGMERVDDPASARRCLARWAA